MNLQITKIPTQTIEHFHNDKSLGLLNQDEHYDLRCQVKEKQITGCYLVFNNTKIEITKDGSLTLHPQGLYDTSTKLLNRLFDI
jgi:hypothetical protein